MVSGQVMHVQRHVTCACDYVDVMRFVSGIGYRLAVSGISIGIGIGFGFRFRFEIGGNTTQESLMGSTWRSSSSSSSRWSGAPGIRGIPGISARTSI